jgi:hypothetical protein
LLFFLLALSGLGSRFFLLASVLLDFDFVIQETRFGSLEKNEVMYVCVCVCVCVCMCV